MSIRLNEVFEDTRAKYQLKLLAGDTRMNTVISWVHMIEDEMIVSRFYGDELVVTTGMKSEEEGWLLSLTKKLEEHGSAGMIINTGKYIHTVPKEVLDFCNTNHFPLIVMPWEFSITNLIQDYCMKIVENQDSDLIFNNACLDAILNRTNKDNYTKVLKKKFDTLKPFHVFCFTIPASDEDTMILKRMLIHIENTVTNLNMKNGSSNNITLFSYESYYVFIINNFTETQINKLIKNLLNYFARYIEKDHFFLGVGTAALTIDTISDSYKNAKTAMKMALYRKEKVVKFDDMGFNQILYSIDNDQIMKSYADKLLAPFEEYDRKHNTNYIEILKSYISNNRSLISVSESIYMHRNTINYRIQKMKELSGSELKTLEDLFPYQVAFYIRDMFKYQ